MKLQLRLTTLRSHTFKSWLLLVYKHIFSIPMIYNKYNITFMIQRLQDFRYTAISMFIRDYHIRRYSFTTTMLLGSWWLQHLMLHNDCNLYVSHNINNVTLFIMDCNFPMFYFIWLQSHLVDYVNDISNFYITTMFSHYNIMLFKT